jgi:glycosyltransferase involved in cell wall biosynthesis
VEDGVTGWLVPPSDPRAWASAIDSALALDGVTLRAMGEAARARTVRLYSLAAMTEATFAVYRGLVEARA